MTTASIRFILGCLVFSALSLPSAFAQTTERVSVNSAGVQGNSVSHRPSSSADGRYIAFSSLAKNLIPGDTNSRFDIFVHDRLTSQTSRVSVGAAGVQANDSSSEPDISASGRYVLFTSVASNLVPGDTNGDPDAFVHDRKTGRIIRVSLGSGAVQGNSNSSSNSISADGHYVAFHSNASNLVPGDTNGVYDVFVRDCWAGITSRVSVNSSGVQGNSYSLAGALSADGGQVAFVSHASDLVAGDTNGGPDIFVHDRRTGQTTRVSVDSAGGQGNLGSGVEGPPVISSDGRIVVFTSQASNLVAGDTNDRPDVFVHDRLTGATARVSVDSAGTQGTDRSWNPSISADGRYVAFRSEASNLVPGDANGAGDVFVHDRQTGQTSLISVDSGGAQGDEESGDPSISTDGRIVAFHSSASNLVPGDTNDHDDAFVHDRGPLGPSLALAGNCPGAVALLFSHGTPGGHVALAHGPAGSFVKLAPPCAGLVLQIATPALGTRITTDWRGSAVLIFRAPAGICGQSVQAVDVTTCVATNVVVL